nr:MAG TPA: hypothetical protein [Siphoviridae sp. ctTqe2]
MEERARTLPSGNSLQGFNQRCEGRNQQRDAAEELPERFEPFGLSAFLFALLAHRASPPFLFYYITISSLCQ